MALVGQVSELAEAEQQVSRSISGLLTALEEDAPDAAAVAAQLAVVTSQLKYLQFLLTVRSHGDGASQILARTALRLKLISNLNAWMRPSINVDNLQSDTKTTDEELDAFDVQHAQFTKQLSTVRLMIARVRRTEAAVSLAHPIAGSRHRLPAAPRTLRSATTRSSASKSSSVVTHLRGQPCCCVVVCCIRVSCDCACRRCECFLWAPTARQAGAAAASRDAPRRGRRLAAPHARHAGERG